MLNIICSYQDGRPNPEFRAAIGAQLQQMRDQLGAGDDPLETLLIERIVLTWTRLQWCELQSAHTLDGGSTVAMADHWDKRLDQAHSRFQKACLALARVRKLKQRPPMSGAAISALLGTPQTIGELMPIRLKR
jgi:hypothetical protein